MNRLEKRQLKPHWLQRRRRLLGGEEAGGFAGGGIPEAPLTGGPFGRYQETWVEVPPEAPKDSQTYGRNNDAWVVIAGGGGGSAATVTFAPAGNISATNVQAALVELDNEKVAKAGDTMTGHLTLPVSPAAANAVRKDYVDSGDSTNTTAIGLKVAKAGDTMTGFLVLHADPDAAMKASTKQYVDNKFLSVVSGAEISDTAPTATQGKLWWESDAGGLWLSYNDGNTTQWIGVGGNVAQGNYVSKAGDTITGNISITAPTASGTYQSGALTVVGGAGIGGALNVNGTVAFNSTTTMGGSLRLFYGSPAIILDRPTVTSTSNAIYGNIATLAKWSITLGNQNALTGGNAGANFAIDRYADTTGAYLDSPIAIMRDTGRVILSSNTVSTSPTTGALTTNGGVGVGGAVFTSGSICIRSPANTSGSLNVKQSNDVSFANGLRVERNADDSYLGLGYYTSSAGFVISPTYISSGGFLPLDIYTNDTHRVRFGTTGTVAIYSTNSSTSPTTGALVVSGGVGIGGGLNIAGSSIMSGDITTTRAAFGAANQGLVGFGNVAGKYIFWDSVKFNIDGGQVAINSSAGSSSTTTGALIVAGGMGVGLTVHASSFVARSDWATVSIDATVGTNSQFVLYKGGVLKWILQNATASDALVWLDADSSHGVQLTQNASAWVSASDRRMRYKRNARTVTGLMDRIDKFRLVEYGQDHSEIGVLAQELEEFAPRLVVKGSSGDDIRDRIDGPDVWWVKPSEAAFVAIQLSKELHERIQEIERLMKVH